MVDSKTTALSAITTPALEDLFYGVDDPGGTPASGQMTGVSVFGEMGGGKIGVDFVGSPAAGDLPIAQGVVDAHDPTDYEAIRKAEAEADLPNVPAWMKWDVETGQAYIDDNVTDLASAKVVMSGLLHMLFLMRDYHFPGLAD